MTGYNLRLLGPPVIECAGYEIEFGLRKAQALAVYLAVTRLRHSRDRLATLFWPLDSQRGARANLRRTLHRIQSALPNQLLLTTKEAVELDPQCQVNSDIETFGSVAAECRRADGRIDYLDVTQRSRLALAADLYTADFLAGFTLPDCPEFDDWQFFQRDELRRGLLDVLEQLVHAWEQVGEPQRALVYAHRWAETDPLHEPAQRKLMELNAALGRRSAALRQFEMWRRKLEVELGVTPDPATTALWETIRGSRLPPHPNSLSTSSPDQLPVESRNNAILRQCLHTTGLLTCPHQPGITQSCTVITTPINNLPRPATPMIGRATELADISRLLVDEPMCRLLTLVGIEGIGKTRIALRAADELAILFRDGVCFVPLPEPGDSQQSLPGTELAGAIAGALGSEPPRPADVEDYLLHHLRHRQMLLVLDNAERALECIDLLSPLLQAAPGIVVLATSTERLRLREEWVYDIMGLSLPPETAEAPQQAVQDYATCDAVQLFLQNARRVNNRFAASPAELKSMIDRIVEVCLLVDGMPLALELASSLTRHMSLAEIARGIEGNFALLTTSIRNVPARHRSMAVVLTSIWQRLDNDEQRLLRRIAAFQDGCTRDAAASIGDVPDTVVNTLVDKALVRCSGDRLVMPKLLCRFALQQLRAKPGELAETLQRYSYYSTALLRRHLHAGRQDLVQLIGADLDNVRAALHYAKATPELLPVAEAVEKCGIIRLHES